MVFSLFDVPDRQVTSSGGLPRGNIATTACARLRRALCSKFLEIRCSETTAVAAGGYLFG
jgi:hypothetical protein